MRRLESNSINIRVVIFAVIVWGLVLSSACFGYSGGSGTEEEPYKIADKADLLELAGTTTDYDKCFILTADINLGGEVFTTAVIADDVSPSGGFQGTAFTGTFDGNSHSILNLTINTSGTNNNFLGLFGRIDEGGIIKNLGLEGVNINEIIGDANSSDFVGGLCGYNYYGNIINCYSTGAVAGDYYAVGGLCGENSHGTITDCISSVATTGNYQTGGLCGFSIFGSIINSHSTGNVSGYSYTGGLCGESHTSDINGCSSTGEVAGNNTTGGLAGMNEFGSISNCYAKGSVTGTSDYTGGLCGSNHTNISNSYATGSVNGSDYTGGLCGYNQGDVSYCYAKGSVIGNTFTGGLCGVNYSTITSCYFLDTAGPDNGYGTPLADEEMKQQGSFVGWDFVGETIDGPNDIWKICEDESYPQLWYEKYGGGLGDANNPYLIYTSCQMNAIGADANDWDKHFKLMADIDLGEYSGTEFNIIGKYVGFQDPCNRPFIGVFDGDGHTISNFTYSTDGNDIGMFSYVAGDAVIRNLGLINPNIAAGARVGSLAARYGNGTIINCYTEGGTISGSSSVGGLIGGSNSYVFRCYSTTSVVGGNTVGGLVGRTLLPEPYNPNEIEIADSYSSGSVSGNTGVGGLVGWNRIQPSVGIPATISNCYAAGAVSGNSYFGGLMGSNDGPVNNSFWDVNSSGQEVSNGGTGKTTAEMQTKSTFTDAGWDFVGEVVNGPNDIWDICEGTNYPKLSWQIPLLGDFVCPDGVDFYDFAVFANQWLLEELSSDVWPSGGDGIVNFFDLAVFANQWQITVDYESLADFVEQWLKTGINYCISDIAPNGGDGIVDTMDFAAFASNWLEGL